MKKNKKILGVFAVLAILGCIVVGIRGCNSKVSDDPNKKEEFPSEVTNPTAVAAIAETVEGVEEWGKEDVSQPTETTAKETTESTTPTTAPTEATEPSTDPTTVPTEPTEPTTAPTNPATEPTEPTAPPATEPVEYTYEWYMELTPAQQQDFYNSFASPEAFFAWYNGAKTKYEDSKQFIEGDSPNIDLGEIIKGNN